MTAVPPLSSRIYSRLLLVYPEALRREYGEEMALLFADELRDADFGGAIRVWRNALVEFFRLALPEFVSSPAFRVPAIAFGFGLASLGAALAMRTAPVTLRVACAAILPTSNLPVIALVCVWFCRDRGVTSLHLTHCAPEEH